MRCLASVSAEMRAALRLISRSAAAWSSRAAVGRALGFAPAFAGIASRAAAAATTAASAASTARALGFDFAARAREFALDRLQAAAFGEPARRAGRRMGGDGKAVPAPEVAFARDQPLAGLEHRGEALRRRRARRRRSGPGGAPAPAAPARYCDERRGAFRQRRIGPHRSPRRPSASARISSTGASRSSPSAAPSAFS